MTTSSLLLGVSGGRSYASQTVTINGQEVTFWFKSLTGRERDLFEESVLVDKTFTNRKGKQVVKRVASNENIRAKLIVLSACAGDGDPTPIFTMDQVDQVGNVEAAILDPLFDCAARLSGLSDSDLVELTKN